MVYIRLLPRGHAKIGVDIWGLRSDQGDEFALPAADAVIDVACYFPAFFPEVGDPKWGELTPAFQSVRRGEYVVTVNSVVRLRAALDYKQPAHSPVYFGENPLGGSIVSDRFTGRILKTSQGY